VGGTETLTATITPSDATNQNVTWSSSDDRVVTVENTGLVTAVAAGTATITVTTVDGGKTAVCAVTITPPPGTQMTRNLSGINVPFRYVPAGSFQRDNTATNILVITNGYWMGEMEVTQELFEAVLGDNPSNFTSNPEDGGPDGWKKLPVEKVSWYAAIAFCNKLSVTNGKDPVYRLNGISDSYWESVTYSDIPTYSTSTMNTAVMDTGKNGYRLPTEMEWMWAAMGADKTSQPNTTGYSKAFPGSNGSNNIDDYAWHSGNSGSNTHEVGIKDANELGLYDMGGNVHEWCWDWSQIYPGGNQTDYTGAASGTSRVIRGASWSHTAGYFTLTGWNAVTPYNGYNYVGFRVICGQ
jgi:formylglycine-generating enzyme required for sulfatase activity